jgi:hypothetical protein
MMYASSVREHPISLSANDVFITNLKKMEEIWKLHNELNELSENEIQNKERMLEISKILVDFYIPNRNKKDDTTKRKDLHSMWEVWENHWKENE